MRLQDRLFIGGEFVDAADGPTFATLNPHDGSVLAKVAEAGPADVDRAVAAAADGVPGLGAAPGVGPRPAAAPAGRPRSRTAADELATLETPRHRPPDPRQPQPRRPADRGHLPLLRRHGRQDPGRRHPGRAGLPQLRPARAARRGRPDRALELPADVLQLEDGPGPGRRQHRRAEAGRADAAELAADRRADGRGRLPARGRQHRPRSGPVAGEHLAAHPGVRKIAFTGSTAVGRRIVEPSAGNVKRVQLELGGKGANIVFADADLEAAVNGSAFAIFHNQGQACIAGSRLILHESIADDFLGRFVALAESIRLGDPLDPATEMGPLTSAGHRDRVLATSRWPATRAARS